MNRTYCNILAFSLILQNSDTGLQSYKENWCWYTRCGLQELPRWSTSQQTWPARSTLALFQMRLFFPSYLCGSEHWTVAVCHFIQLGMYRLQSLQQMPRSQRRRKNAVLWPLWSRLSQLLRRSWRNTQWPLALWWVLLMFLVWWIGSFGWRRIDRWTGQFFTRQENWLGFWIQAGKHWRENLFAHHVYSLL